MRDALVEAGVDRCHRAGLPVVRPDDGGQPPAIATPSDTASDTIPVDRPAGLPADRPVAVEPIGEPSPTLVLSRLWNDYRNDRTALFVAPDDAVAVRIESLLADPVGVRAADADGRTFYAGPDRIPLAEGGYAAVPTGTTLQWRESTTVRTLDGIDRSEVAGQRSARTESSADGPWLELHADGGILVRLDGVGALDCPSRERFPYAYARDRDKQIRVVDFAGRPVQRYPGIGAMRDGGFRPVPAPLVPEHMFDTPIDGRWAVVVAEDR